MNLRRGYQRRSNIVKDENGDLLADRHNILIKWKNYISVIECAQGQLCLADRKTSEQLVPDPSPFEVAIATAKLIR
jgi:hypothetical protein